MNYVEKEVVVVHRGRYNYNKCIIVCLNKQTTTTTTTSLLAFPIYIWYCLNKNKVIHVHVISTITKTNIRSVKLINIFN